MRAPVLDIGVTAQRQHTAKISSQQRCTDLDARSRPTDPQLMIIRPDSRRSEPAIANIALEAKPSPRPVVKFRCDGLLSIPPPSRPQDATRGCTESGRFLTTVRCFQLARHARHHLPIVHIVRSIQTATSPADSRYGNRAASNGLHPCRPPHTHNRYACVTRNAILSAYYRAPAQRGLSWLRVDVPGVLHGTRSPTPLRAQNTHPPEPRNREYLPDG